MRTWMVLLLALIPASSSADTLLVRHARHCTKQMAQEFHRRMGREATVFQYLQWSSVRDVAEHYEHYKESPLFDRVEHERTYWTSRIPNDPRWPEQWGPINVSAPLAWDFSFGQEVVVAVIDTGIDYSHPDLVNALWTGPSGEHGYTAAGGYLFAGGRDDYFHGTHVAGIIAATMDNHLGIAGLSPNVKLMSLKFLASNGSGRTSDAVLVIEKMIELKRSGVNIRVSNNSWGGFGSDPLLDDAFALAEAEGIINVCAAGNQNVDTDLNVFFPSCIPIDGIISVQASDPDDARVGFSNYGWVTTDLFAPGISVLSTFTNAEYATFGGTSMASPHVAAACAAMFGRNPGLTVKQCRDLLLSPEARDTTTNGNSSTFGGRLNLFKCVTHPRLFNPPVNHAPTITMTRTNLILASGQSAALPAVIHDVDNDPLRTNVVSFGYGFEDYAGFVQTVPNATTITNSGWAVDGAIRTHVSAVDGKGGGAIAQASTFLLRDESKVRDLGQVVTFTATHQGGALWHFLLTGPTNLTTYTVTEHPEGGGADTFFNFQPNVLYGVSTHTPTNKAIMHRATVADVYGNFLNTPQHITPNGSAYRHPKLKVKFNTTRGTVPLRVVADMSETDYGDAKSLFFICYDTPNDVLSQVVSYSITNVGIHLSYFYVVDLENRVSDQWTQVFSVLPPPIVSLDRTNSALRVSWLPANATDVLERSANLMSWAPVYVGLPPVTVPLTGPQRFFRVQQQ